ncbi:hypothetical protein FN961_21730 [Shewanella hanedai]|uniref:Uncharacterized protein n=1 Tax=Shewanella hanedai TaxID=25 RepID=A0A553JII9_SHEHA|nr:hypothetical protein FN961_21730 [Shewanella hanedai]
MTLHSNRRDKHSGVNAAVTFRDRDVTVEPTGIVLAACHRSIYTFSEPQAISSNYSMPFNKLNRLSLKMVY